MTMHWLISLLRVPQFLAAKGISMMDKLLQLTSDCFQTQDCAQREVFLAGKDIKLFMKK
jgi:hypothetical protein